MFKAAQRAQEAVKFPAEPESELNAHLDMLLSISRELGYQGGDRVLDLGCGIGRTLEALLARGLDAYGVDVGEWWGKDYAEYWQDSPIPKENVRARLSVTNEQNYKLAYPDNYFDLVISSQVFEHVFNYEEVFRELARVLKPHGVSVHIFPGRGTPLEPHLFIPFIPLAKKTWWLLLWSFVKRRHRPAWLDEYEFLKVGMSSNNYPSREQLHSFARAAGVHVEFREDLYLRVADGRPSKILKKAERLHMGWIGLILRRLCQRTMLLRKGASQ